MVACGSVSPSMLTTDAGDGSSSSDTGGRGGAGGELGQAGAGGGGASSPGGAGGCIDANAAGFHFEGTCGPVEDTCCTVDGRLYVGCVTGSDAASFCYGICEMCL